MPSLYLVHTTISPTFLNQRETRHAPAWNSHGAFVRKIMDQCPDAHLPYLALFAHGNGIIPDCVEAGSMVYANGGVVVPITNASVKKDESTSITLDDFIKTCVEGQPIPSLVTTPRIGGIVEFSPTELYPAVMERLAERYEIRRITIE